MDRRKIWGVVAGLAWSTGFTATAAEPIVQDFDGWKITIRPGVSRIQDPVPPSPRPVPATRVPQLKSKIQLLSLRQETPPTPEPEGEPTPMPAVEPASEDPAVDPRDIADDDLPKIIPGESSQCCDDKTIVSPPAGTVDPRYLSQQYAEIYNSIPFNRAEYEANPSYRHDTAVEFLFGKMRPTVVHRNYNYNYSSGGYGGYGFGVPWSYGGLGYAYPPLQLVVPGTGLRIHRLN